MSEKHRYQMVPAPSPDEETLLEDGEDGDHYTNGSALMNGTRTPGQRKTLTSIRRANFQVDNANSHVLFQRAGINKGHQQQFYMRYKAKQWYFRPAVIFTASTFTVTLLALLFLKSGAVPSSQHDDEGLEAIPIYDRPNLIVTKRLPRDVRLRPTVANGQLGYAIGANQLTIAGIYNGQKSNSHAARVPLPVEFTIAPPTNVSEWAVLDHFHTLDTLNGMYTETIALRNVRLRHTANITKSVYAHRAYRDLLVVELALFSEVANDRVAVPLTYANTNMQQQQLASEDILFEPTMQDTTTYQYLSACIARGRTKQPEFTDDDTQQARDVTLMWPCLPAKPVIYLWTGGPEVLMVVAGYDFGRVNATFYRHQPLMRWLSVTHRAAWHALWASGNISIGYRLPPAAKPQSTMIMHSRHKRHDMGDAGEGPSKADAMKSHVNKNFRLAQITAAAQYYLWSEIPMEFGSDPDVWTDQMDGMFGGVSRSGLAHAARAGCYSGHVFWDQEMYTLPTLTALQPQMAQRILSSRVRRLPAARKNAQIIPGAAGARYPWQSAATGRDVASDNVQMHALHETCDISAALVTYARSGGNLSALSVATTKKAPDNVITAMDVAVDVAKFFLTRLSCQNGTALSSGERRQRRHGDDDDDEMDMGDGMSHNERSMSGMGVSEIPAELSACHIRNVMGPDEGSSPVDDSYYTNACAHQALLTPSWLCNRSSAENLLDNFPFKTFCNSADAVRMLREFETYAARLHIPLGKFNATWYYHPEFVGYDPAQRGRIKRAEAILTAYPLGYRNKSNDAAVSHSNAEDDFNRELRRHDLHIYEAVMQAGGSALSSAMYAIAFREFNTMPNERALAHKHFREQFEHVRGPYMIWSDSNAKDDNYGAVNFLPAIGGFLQSIVNGYAGLRYTSDKHMLLDVGLLPNGVEYAVNGIHYYRVQFNLRVLRKISVERVERRRKRHGGDEDEEEPHAPPPEVALENNQPIVVELTWHLPRTYSALMSQWVRQLNGSSDVAAPEAASSDAFEVQVCQDRNIRAVSRKRRHDHDEEADKVPRPPTTSSNAEAAAKNGDIGSPVCFLLKDSGRVYTFPSENGAKLSISVTQRTPVQRTKRI